MQDEKEVSVEDVKKEFEELQNKADGTATEETSTEEEKPAESSSEDVKTETAEETVEEKTPETVPYSRFKERNDRAKELEELAEAAKEYIVKDPETGKLKLKLPDDVKDAQEKEDKGLELTEEEQLALDSVQLSTIRKVIAHENQQRERQWNEQRNYQQETDKWWNKAKEDYPELGGKDFKETPLYKRAVQILKDQHVQWSADKKTFYIPPKAQYFSVLQAEKELAREKVKTSQAKIEEKKNQKTNVFVEKKSGQAVAKKSVDKKDFEDLNPREQEDALRAQFEERNSDE